MKFKRYLRLRGRERSEVEDELGYHLEMKTEQLMGEGMSAEQARQEAMRQFGDRDRIREEVTQLVEGRAQRERRASFVDALRQDIHFAIRQLRGAPVFALVAMVTIGLGIGATTAIFSVVRAVLLRPLPYSGAERIVLIGESDDPRSADPQTTTSFHNFEDWKARTKSFEAMAVYDGWSPALTGSGEATRLSGSLVSSEIFDVFRIKPALGRPMLASDNVPNAPRIVWISWAMWQTRFAGDPGVIGTTITLNGNAREIVGVLPRDYVPPNIELRGDVWGPNYKDDQDTRSSRYLNVVARLESTVTLEQARAELATISERLQSEYPESNKGQHAVVFELRDLVIGGRTRGPVMLLMLASVLVLLIACANTSNLLIARGTYRAKEFAIRSALGTTGGRIVRQLLTESIVLGALGAMLGLLLAASGIRVLIRLAPSSIQAQNVSIDPVVLGFALVSAFAAAIAFGLLPALRATRDDVQKTLREEGRGSTSRHARRVRGALAVVQLSLALSLVLGAGLLIKSFARVLQVDPGIDARQLLAADLSLPAARYQGEAMPRFYEELIERTRLQPGIRAATVASIVPFSGGWDRIAVDTGITKDVPGADLPEGDRYIVGHSYFKTMGIQLLQGREFTAADRADAPPVAVVDEVFARKVERNGTALGMLIKVPGRDSSAAIVGVVNHVKHYGLDAESGGQIYVSHLQYPWRWMSLIVRAERDAETLATPMRAVVRSIDVNLPVTGMTTIETYMADRTAVRRFVLALLSAFAGIALLLAAIGLYGVIAFTIAQRRREFGIRLALGASPGELVRMVMREGALLVALGTSIGVLVAAAGSRTLSSLLFGVGALDPIVALGSAALLALTAGLATWLPARGAARANPLESLYTP